MSTHYVATSNDCQDTAYVSATSMEQSQHPDELDDGLVVHTQRLSCLAQDRRRIVAPVRPKLTKEQQREQDERREARRSQLPDQIQSQTDEYFQDVERSRPQSQSYHQPAHHQPAHHQPAYHQPAYPQPAHHQPPYHPQPQNYQDPYRQQSSYYPQAYQQQQPPPQQETILHRERDAYGIKELVRYTSGTYELGCETREADVARKPKLRDLATCSLISTSSPQIWSPPGWMRWFLCHCDSCRVAVYKSLEIDISGAVAVLDSIKAGVKLIEFGNAEWQYRIASQVADSLSQKAELSAAQIGNLSVKGLSDSKGRSRAVSSHNRQTSTCR